MTEGIVEEIKPPVTSVGVIGWVRANLFNNTFNSILTLVTLYVLWQIVPAFIRWAIIDAQWFSSAEACRGAEGACWTVIPANIRFILFGFYPYELQWRPMTAMVLLVGLLFYSRNRKHWKKSLLYGAEDFFTLRRLLASSMSLLTDFISIAAIGRKRF